MADIPYSPIILRKLYVLRLIPHFTQSAPLSLLRILPISLVRAWKSTETPQYPEFCAVKINNINYGKYNMAAVQSGSKISQLIRRGWIEIPDIMVGLGMLALGSSFIGIGLYKKSKMDVERPFKDHYIVKRDDDPDAAKYLRFHQNPKY